MPDFPLGNARADRQDAEAFIRFERLKEIINEALHTSRDILAYHAIREYDEKLIAADTNIQRIVKMFFDQIGGSYERLIPRQVTVCIVHRLEMV